jgi:hypothetical protein
MKTTPVIENLIYLLLIILSLAILTLVAIAPDDFLNTGAVYRGF